MNNSNPQKHRKGLNRIIHATGYSIQGLQAAWHETAFRQEVILSFFFTPLAFWLGRTWLESLFLLATLAGVLITELLNTAIESAIDRIGLQRHELSKRAKDMGSAAVLIALLLCIVSWGSLFIISYIYPHLS